MSRPQRGIPFGPQFSPEQTPLPDLLGVLAAHQAGYDDLVHAIEVRFFAGGGATPYNKRKKADNTTLALRDYGIVQTDKATLTDLGRELVALRGTADRLYEAFARHILLKLNGLAFVRTVQDMLTSKTDISLESLARALRQRGIAVPPTATHLSAMKGWLKLAGVFTGGRNSYEVDDRRLQGILGGLAAADVDALADLPPLHRAFLKALARFSDAADARSNDVAKLAESLYGVTFPWKSLYSTVLREIEAAGFVTCRKTTSGRGAKPYLVTPTEKFAREIVLPILDGYPDKLGAQLRELRRTPLDQIVRALTVGTTHVRGKALEMLALWLMFALDLDFVFWRKRGKETGGAEVDVVVESARLVFSRWQIQCKNGKATLEDVAKEYGLARHLRSNVIMVVTTRRFSSDAKGFADSIMTDTNLQVILLDEADLSQVVASPARLAEVLHAQAEHAMQVKDLHRAEE